MVAGIYILTCRWACNPPAQITPSPQKGQKTKGFASESSLKSWRRTYV